MKKIPAIAIVLLLIAALLPGLTGCDRLGRVLQYNLGSKGLSPERQEEVDAIAADYAERLQGVTWWHPIYPASYRFFADGTVEENGVLSEPGAWTVSYSDRNGTLILAETPRVTIEEQCDFYLFYDSPLQNRRIALRLSFNEDGNPVFGDVDPEVYVPGPDYFHEIPSDATVDSFFTQTVWGEDLGDGNVGGLWILWEDGWGAETVGSYQGELIYPVYFHWACKDDLLFIDWYVDETSNQGPDVYRIERGALDFYRTPYLDRDESNREHMIPSGEIDIASIKFQ